MSSIIARDATDADAGAIADILKNTGWFAHLNSASPEEIVNQIPAYVSQWQTS